MSAQDFKKFISETPYLRLVSAIMIETSEGWEVGRIWMNTECYKIVSSSSKRNCDRYYKKVKKRSGNSEKLSQ